MRQKAFSIFTALLVAVIAMSQPHYNSVTTIHPTVGSYAAYPTTGTRTVEYFMHGNILSLKRNGRLADGTIPGASTEYACDANGNIMRNADKGIVSVEYDDRNMPKRITFTSGQTTEYTYSTDGRKWRVSYGFGSAPVTAPMLTVMDGGSELMAADNRQTVDYCGNVIYRNGQLERILIEGGYITYESGSYKYHYYIKDHLGNNRVVIDDNKAVEQVVHYYPFGAQFLDGIGTDTQPYKYNGKELDRMNGLDWYDYGARHYDASLGRWGTMDPLAEKYYDISPYAYCHNNPINAIDPNGDIVLFINGFHFGDGGTSSYWDGIDNKVMRLWNDNNPRYIDGSLGGAFNLAASALLVSGSVHFQNAFLWNIARNCTNLNTQNRINGGYIYAKINAESIVQEAISKGETIKLVTHSMGSAFAKGLVKGLFEYAKKNNLNLQKIMDFELDLAPYEPTQQKADKRVKTTVYQHTYDVVAGTEPMPDAKNNVTRTNVKKHISERLMSIE